MLFVRIQDEKATDIQMVSTQINAMLSLHNLKAYDPSTLRRIYYTACPMPTELLRTGIEIFGPIFLQGYGQTESGPQIIPLFGKDHFVLVC